MKFALLCLLIGSFPARNSNFVCALRCSTLTLLTTNLDANPRLASFSVHKVALFLLGEAVKLDRTAFVEEEGSCLDLQNLHLKERISKLLNSVYDPIGGATFKATRNVTTVEKSSSHFQLQSLVPINLGGGYQPQSHQTFIGDLYKVSFTEDKVENGGVPTTYCHTLTILFSMPDIATPMDHTELPCTDSDAHLTLAADDLDTPDIDFGTVGLDDDEKREIKIMSYNVWNFEKTYERRLELMVEQIITESADVVSMQEVRWSNHEYPATEAKRGDSVRDFASRLYAHGYKHWVWRPAMVYPQSAQLRTIEGLAIFSKLPISDVESYALDRWATVTEDYHQRILLRVEVQTPSGPFNTFTSHFSLFGPARDHNCVVIRNIMHWFTTQGPVALMGDLNAEIHESDGLKYLLGKKTIAASTGYLADAMDFTLRNIDPKNLKAMVSNKLKVWTFTTLAKAPKKVIDFIFYDPKQLDIVDYRVIANTFKDQKQQPSDHRPIVASFRFK